MQIFAELRLKPAPNPANLSTTKQGSFLELFGEIKARFQSSKSVDYEAAI